MAADGHTLLELGDRGADADAPARALLLAALVADPDAAPMLPLGELNRRIWRLRREFGLPPTAAAVCNCPQCGEVLEFSLPPDLAPPARRETGAETPAGRITLGWQGRRYWLRQPTLADFADGGFDPMRLGAAPWQDPEFAAHAQAALAAADPALAIEIALDCPQCGEHFAEDFDACGFLWAELDDRARDLTQDVVRLAQAFGWGEAAILDMSAARRARYLAELAP